jgi:uncharacterized membrane protein YgaE (UPF0421/DUF939 family)
MTVLPWREGAVRAERRVRRALWPAAHAALAAALAWLIARRVLGHAQPFFAPIAAAIALSTSHMQRSRRIVQMVIGVLLGILVGELGSALLGTSTVALGVIVLATMLLAVMLGAGFVGEGMMFVNQSAASAILVVAVHGHGIGGERGLDALVGGAVALVVGVILFPAAPLPRLREAEQAVLRSLRSALDEVMALLRSGEQAQSDWTLATGYEIHEQLARLAQARMTARANVRIAPRRWHLRPVVDAEDRRIARLDLLANSMLSLVRAVTGALDDHESLPAALQDQIASFATAIGLLTDTPQPWPESITHDTIEIAKRAIEQASAQRVDRTPVIASILRAGARDLLELTQGRNGAEGVAG